MNIGNIPDRRWNLWRPAATAATRPPPVGAWREVLVFAARRA